MKHLSLLAFCTIFLLAASSCSHYIVNNSGYIRPPKKKKIPYERRFSKLTNSETIDTTAIYYLSNSYYTKTSTQYKLGDAYIRFYNDGHFKLQGLKKYPTAEEVNDPNEGIVGYYYVKKNAVKMQVYSDIGGGSFQLDFGYIDENKDLVVMQENPYYDFAIGYTEEKIKRKLKRSAYSPKVYRKVYLENMTYEKPNW